MPAKNDIAVVLLVNALALLAVAGLLFLPARSRGFREAGGQPAREQVEAADRQFAKAVQDPDSREVRAWVQGVDPSLREFGGGDDIEHSLNGTKIAEVATELYAAGAVRVTAVGIDQEPVEKNGKRTMLQSTDTLIIELPADRAKRRLIFKICNIDAERQGYDAEQDHEQQYLLIWHD